MYHVTTAGGLPEAGQLQVTSSPSMTKAEQLDSTGLPGYSETRMIPLQHISEATQGEHELWDSVKGGCKLQALVYDIVS